MSEKLYTQAEVDALLDGAVARIEGQRLLIEELRREKESLAVKIKDLNQLTEQMRDCYWRLSRRLKFFANQFTEDETSAGAISFIVSESNAEWLLSHRYNEPSDSEIPF